MILSVSPAAPLAVRLAADGVLALHIGAGVVGVGSGALALSVRKGGRLHRIAGDVFLISMLVMAGIGAAVSPLLPQPSNTTGGLMAIYLVLTGWAAVRPTPRWLTLGAPMLAFATAGAGVLFGLEGMASPDGTIGGAPYQAPFVMATLIALAAVADVSVILRGGVAGAQRLARHLWRMCAALMVAAGSGLSQPRLIPSALQGSPLVFLPLLVILATMIYWLIRLRRPSRRGKAGLIVAP